MENTTVSKTDSAPLVPHAVRFGAILGAISIIITLVLYIVDYALLGDWKIGLILLAIYIGFVIYAGSNYRSEVGGYLSYGKAYQHGFLTFAVSGVISILFSILLYTVIDPELPQKMAEVMAENSAKMMASFGMPEDQIDEQISKMKEDMPGKYGAVGQLTNLLIAMVVYAIVSLITALVVRRNEPEIM